MSAKSVVSMLMLMAVATSATRSKREDPDEEVTYMALESEEEEVTTMVGDAGTIFELGEESATVEAASSEFDGGEITNLMEVRTKLKFIGNQVELRNADLVPTLVDDITGQMDQHEGKQFLLCLHVGTTASANIKNSRPGFIEGRSATLMDALHQHDDALKVSDGVTTIGADVLEHFGSTRFAGLVIKVYSGDGVPECKQDDLVPPSA